MASRTAVQRGVALGVATAVAAGSAGTAAESRAAPEGINEDALRSAKELLKDGLADLKSSGLLTSTHSADGTEWLDVDAFLESTLDLAESVAAEPSVQRTIMEKERSQPLVLRMLSEQPRLAQSSALSGSFVDVPRMATVADAASVSSSIPSPSLSAILSVEEENEALRAENAALKAQLRDKGQRPGVARLQALVRGVLTRTGFYDDESTARRLAPTPPRVSVRVGLTSPRVPSDAAEGAMPLVSLSLVVKPGLTIRKNRREGTHMPARAPPKPADYQLPMRSDAIVVTVSLVIGMLALLISRNPSGARAAAAGAAATVAMLAARAQRRATMSAPSTPCA